MSLKRTEPASRPLARFPLIPQTTIAALLLCLVASLGSATTQAAEYAFSGPTMGTKYSVKLLTEASAEERAALGAAILEELDGVNQRMSTYLPDSELSQFNSSQATDWFSVSPATAAVVAKALEISEASQGGFDVTVGPLVNRWSFGPDKTITERPSKDEIAQLLLTVGYDKLQVRLDPPALKKEIPDLYVDLSAIAKGYAVDRVALRLETEGIESYFVEVGGEVRCRGLKPSGHGWRTGIRRPQQGTELAQAAVELGQRAIATSGDYENFVLLDGQRYSHTIDPATGEPIANGLTSVSVVADDCMTADALATAVMVLGYERGQALVESLGGELFTIAVADNGTFFEQHSPGFPLLEEPVTDKPQSSFLGVLIATAVIFGLALLGMSIGVIFRRAPISGSCGGLAALKQGKITSVCDACGKKTKECQELQDAIRASQTQESSEAT